jgi:hypothetical protein
MRFLDYGKLIGDMEKDRLYPRKPRIQGGALRQRQKIRDLASPAGFEWRDRYICIEDVNLVCCRCRFVSVVELKMIAGLITEISVAARIVSVEKWLRLPRGIKHQIVRA